MSIAFGTRRAEWVKVEGAPAPLAADELARFEAVDLFYRSLCALLYNYVPLSGHPGGSISSGRFVAGILFDAMDYELAKPERADADVVSYAAGHKAMGLYSMWALRDELARVGNPSLHFPRRRLSGCASRTSWASAATACTSPLGHMLSTLNRLFRHAP